MLIGNKIIRYSQLDSTNDEAKRLLKTDPLEGTVVIAEAQTKGRGKPGSQWFSVPNLGIYLSVIVKPNQAPNDLALITSVGAKAVVATITKMTGLRAGIKPPNDVLVDGKKVCGILVERVASGAVVIGIGLNVNHELGSFPPELKGKAVSLKILTKQTFEVDKIIQVLLIELEREYLAYLNKLC